MNWFDAAAQSLYGGVGQQPWMAAQDTAILRMHDTNMMQQAGMGCSYPGQIVTIDDTNSTLNFTTELEGAKPEKVDEFKQLSNYKFHELLEKFKNRANS